MLDGWIFNIFCDWQIPLYLSLLYTGHTYEGYLKQCGDLDNNHMC